MCILWSISQLCDHDGAPTKEVEDLRLLKDEVDVSIS